MSARIIEHWFPHIREEGYQITSAETLDYNCFAWAVGDMERWWSPVAAKGYHWPKGVPPTLDLKTFIRLYKQEGNFERCDDGKPEEGFEKIAIYCDDQKDVSHVARQVQNGKWTSKLGDWEDIEHASLKALEGDFYGEVAAVLKRKILP